MMMRCQVLDLKKLVKESKGFPAATTAEAARSSTLFLLRPARPDWAASFDLT
jgi:hypothetical protein